MTTENSNDSTNDPTNAASAHAAHSDGVMDRRLGLDRRRGEVADPTNLERRRGPSRLITFGMLAIVRYFGGDCISRHTS